VRSLAQRVRDARHASQPARLRESWEHPRALERLSLARSSLRLGEFPSG
jgi:hypothetical protein